MEEKISEEREQKAGRLSAIVEAMKELSFLVDSIRGNHQLTANELIEAHKRISDPLFMYANLLETL